MRFSTSVLEKLQKNNKVSGTLLYYCIITSYFDVASQSKCEENLEPITPVLLPSSHWPYREEDIKEELLTESGEKKSER